MTGLIKQQLELLEREYSIRILYACESGSRAWGFTSPDSDYDVRFIYARRLNNYLSINEIKDVIDLPVNDLLDIGGWDIKKALKLFLKSNGPLYEWLQSPIIYKNDSGFDKAMQTLMPQYFSLRAAGNHYLSMANNAVVNDFAGEEVKIKRYCYAIRSALACLWIVIEQSVPPMELDKLRVLITDITVQHHINKLLEIKLVSDEKTLMQHDVVLDDWLNNTLAFCETGVKQLAVNHHTTEELNEVFRTYIQP
jgi:uncharacterized protein